MFPVFTFCLICNEYSPKNTHFKIDWTVSAIQSVFVHCIQFSYVFVFSITVTVRPLSVYRSVVAPLSSIVLY